MGTTPEASHEKVPSESNAVSVPTAETHADL